MKKQLATIYLDDNGHWKILTPGPPPAIWYDDFETEEEATTYALREGCKVEGC